MIKTIWFIHSVNEHNEDMWWTRRGWVDDFNKAKPYMGSGPALSTLRENRNFRWNVHYCWKNGRATLAKVEIYESEVEVTDRA